MALNPFFLQGSPGEQRLVQDLINEQLKIYGVDVIYIPRKFVKKQTIIKEIQSSKFDDNFAIEAYVNNYDGYTGQGDILTKFGMSLKDELSLIISKERFEDFISPFINLEDDPEIEIFNRPREGDIIYFPLGRRIFEVKFVEHEVNFYQLGKLYVYELKCELFEYEDEMGGSWTNINTTVQEIDSSLEDVGYITSLKLLTVSGESVGVATTTAGGYVRKIVLTNDGYNYTSTPTVAISTAPVGGINASAVAITTYMGGVHSVKEILLIEAGSGYTSPPTVTISGGGGTGAAATCVLVTDGVGVKNIGISTGGFGYLKSPNILIGFPYDAPSIRAVGKVIVNNGLVSQILLSDAGIGYTANPIVIIDPPTSFGISTSSYEYNEIISVSGGETYARVKSWDIQDGILKVGQVEGKFAVGDIIVGQASSTSHYIESIQSAKFEDKYEDNDQIEQEADQILDFSESNPFGNY